MGNIALYILWGIVLLLLIILILLNILSIQELKNPKIEVVDLDNQKCTPDFSTLPQVNNRCCRIGNTVTASRYLEEFDMVVNPISIPYERACEGFCPLGMLDQNTCRELIGQEKYQNCINLTRPVDCTSPSKPIAAKGTTYFYINAAGNSSCTTTSLC